MRRYVIVSSPLSSHASPSSPSRFSGSATASTSLDPNTRLARTMVPIQSATSERGERELLGLVRAARFRLTRGGVNEKAHRQPINSRTNKLAQNLTIATKAAVRAHITTCMLLAAIRLPPPADLSLFRESIVSLRSCLASPPS